MNKRPVLQREPQPGELYEWDTDPPQLFLIIGLRKKHREVWLMRAIDMQKGCETQIGVRRRERVQRLDGGVVMDLDEKPKGVDPHAPVGDFAVGQLWQDWVNGGTVTAECVVVALGRYHVALAVLSATDGHIQSDGMTPGAVIRRNRNFVWNYWRQLAS